MKKTLLLLWMALLCSVASAQRTHLEMGDEYFRKRFYLEAIKEYQLALDEKVVVKKYYMTERVARTYRMLFDYENAVTWYAKLMEFKEENEVQNILHYAILLMNLEKYQEAKSVFEEYAKRNQKSADEYIGWCNWAISHKDSTKAFSVYKTDLETGSRSMGIAFYQSGLVYSKPQIVDFTLKTAFYDLAYVACKDSVKFDAPVLLAGDLNRSFYEGTPNFSSDQKTLFYSGNSSTTTNYRPRKADKQKISKDGVNILKIYSATLSNSVWTGISELSFNSNEFDCVFPFVTKDGSSIYFVSNMPGGFGGYDVYRSDKDANGKWGQALNLGAEVNTPYDEMYPFVHGDSLYFSSKGKAGFGGADIFVARLNGKQVVSVSNLGKPFNSPKDDFSLIAREVNGLLEGYFSSNREGTHGYDRIYFFRQHPKPVYPDTIQGVALNKITLQPLKNVKITLTGNDQVSQQITDQTGKVELILDKGVAYQVTFELDGFQKKVVDIPAEERSDAIAKFGDLQLEPAIVKNTVIKIPNIYFDYDKATLRPESFKVLAQIIDFLNDNPTVRVEMSAHTDARGSDTYNLKLSQKRAESTVKYLIDHGIDSKRLVPKGYGELKILNQCKNGIKCSEEEHEFNRRVEMKVL